LTAAAFLLGCEAFVRLTVIALDTSSQVLRKLGLTLLLVMNSAGQVQRLTGVMGGG
jgi:hypothetical protein